MTLNDLFHVKICFRTALLDSESLTCKNNCVKSNKHRPIYYQRQKCRSMSLVSGDINYFYIFESILR